MKRPNRSDVGGSVLRTDLKNGAGVERRVAGVAIFDAAPALAPPSSERSIQMNLARRANHSWSSEEDSELTGLMDDGQSAKAIAIKLNALRDQSAEGPRF